MTWQVSYLTWPAVQVLTVFRQLEIWKKYFIVVFTTWEMQSTRSLLYSLAGMSHDSVIAMELSILTDSIRELPESNAFGTDYFPSSVIFFFLCYAIMRQILGRFFHISSVIDAVLWIGRHQPSKNNPRFFLVCVRACVCPSNPADRWVYLNWTRDYVMIGLVLRKIMLFYLSVHLRFLKIPSMQICSTKPVVKNHSTKNKFNGCFGNESLASVGLSL